MKSVLITGATGLVGKALVQSLLANDYSVKIVTRSQQKAKILFPKNVEVIECDLSQNRIDSEQLSHVHAVVNLLGESIAEGRWTQRRKNELYNSRVISTRNLVQSFNTAPQVFVSASAIGIYKDQQDQWINESSEHGNDFLSQLCLDWESEAKQVLKINNNSNSRVILLRTGLVLSNDGGALKKMLPAFRLGLGGRLGHGEQWMSWIHRVDLVRMIIFLINNSVINGAVNAVAPEPVKNIDFSKILAKSLHRPLGPAVPEFVLKLAFGEMSTVLLSSQRVSCKKIEQSGFKFQYSNLEKALLDCIEPTHKS